MSRLATLDGLRGAAAVGVALHHFGLVFGLPMFGRGYLAVDFFFALSGFVLAFAYEPLLRSGMPWLSYARERIIRLYPVLFLGSIAGMASLLATNHSFPIDPTLAFVLQVLCIPVFLGGITDIFLVNGVQWSLLFELLINGAHAAVAQSLSWTMLCVIALAGLGALVFFAVEFGRVDGGWGSDGFLAGFARVVFSFSVGVGMCRLYKAGRLKLPKIPYLLIVAPLVAILFLPTTRGGSSIAIDLVAVVVVFPLLIAFAVNTTVPTVLLPAAVFLGAASYPLYILHPSILRVVHAPIESAGFAPPLLLAVVLGVVAATVVLAWAADLWFDRPVRALIKSVKRRSPQLS